MRKWIAVMVMIFVSANFYLYIKRIKPDHGNKKELSQILEEIREEIPVIDPDDSVAVVTMHNRLMNHLYGQDITDEQVEEIITMQRELYETGFLAMTSLEEQLYQVQAERESNKEKSMKILKSEIMNSYEEPPGVVKIEVIHYTNQADMVRLYLLKKDYNLVGEQEKWKIYGWKDIDSSNIQEEEK